METSTRADAAYQALRRAIIEQALAPGAKLREDEIGGHFGISRTLVRAALMRLSSEGLVDIRLKRTATVARPSVDEARAIFEVRRCLEREVVRLLVERWKPAIAAELGAHADAEDAAAHAGDLAAAGRLAGEFHIVLARLTGNPLLERYVSEIVSRCSLILAIYGRPHVAECATTEHRGVIAALSARDADRACDLMTEHLDAVKARALPDQAAPRPPRRRRRAGALRATDLSAPLSLIDPGQLLCCGVDLPSPLPAGEVEARGLLRRKRHARAPDICAENARSA